MKTIELDGKNISFDDCMSGEQINQLVKCPQGQFAVIVRNKGMCPEIKPIPKDRQMHPLQDGDRFDTMYEVGNGLGVK